MSEEKCDSAGEFFCLCTNVSKCENTHVFMHECMYGVHAGGNKICQICWIN